MKASRRHLNKNRLEALTDGVYAIALTLAVLTIDISETSTGNGTPSFSVVIPQVIHYAIAFFILASFWLAHHRMTDVVKKVDNTYISLNITMLFFVALVPFTTDLIGDYGEFPLAVALNAGNLMIIGLLHLVSVYYANTKEGILHDGITDDFKFSSLMKSLSVPLACLIVIIYGYTVSASGASFFFLLIPVFRIIFMKFSPTE